MTGKILTTIFSKAPRIPRMLAATKRLGKTIAGLAIVDQIIEHIPDMFQATSEMLGMSNAKTLISDRGLSRNIREQTHKFHEALRSEIGFKPSQYDALIGLILTVKHGTISTLELAHDENNTERISMFSRIAGFAVACSADTDLSPADELEMMEELYTEQASATPVYNPTNNKGNSSSPSSLNKVIANIPKAPIQ